MSLEKAEYFLGKARLVIERKKPEPAGNIEIKIDGDGKQGLDFPFQKDMKKQSGT